MTGKIFTSTQLPAVPISLKCLLMLLKIIFCANNYLVSQYKTLCIEISILTWLRLALCRFCVDTNSCYFSRSEILKPFHQSLSCPWFSAICFEWMIVCFLFIPLLCMGDGCYYIACKTKKKKATFKEIKNQLQNISKAQLLSKV